MSPLNSRFLITVLLLPAAAAQAPHSIHPLSTTGVAGGVAEIVDATDDGRTLVYTDSGAGALGVVDLSDPAAPVQLASLPVAGEPTSVAVCGRWALATVWTDKPTHGGAPPAFLPGELAVVDLVDPRAPVITGTVDIGYHPDSLRATVIGNQLIAVVAIENEPVVVQGGLVIDEDRPGSPDDVSPPGLIQIVVLDPVSPGRSVVIDLPLPAARLAAAGLLYPSDPQPEFVALHGTTAAISLQENNGIAVVDLQDPHNPILARVFGLGVAASRDADLTEDDDIRFIERYPDAIGVSKPAPLDGGGNPVPGGVRFPDAIAFTPDGNALLSADEGELNFTGGRGFSVWSLDGSLIWSDVGLLERVAVVFGHYPEGRSENKGIEIEGIATSRVSGRDYALVLSERGSFMAVFGIDDPAAPRLLQVLPTGVSPEGIAFLPQRDLLVTADEVSGTLSVFGALRGRYRPDRDQPQLFSADGTPWAALSGLAAAGLADTFWAVPDNALPTSIYAVVAGGHYAPVLRYRAVRRNGKQARYDGEGIAVDTSILAAGGHPLNRGWWLASEGDAQSAPNLFVQVDPSGAVVREIQLPAHIDPASDPALGGAAVGPAGGQTIRSNGFEGCAVSADGRYLLACIQRDFVDEFPTGNRYARIARYDLRQIARGTAPSSGLRFGGDWEFFYVPLDSNDPTNWAGLSEVTVLGADRYAVLERDKELGLASQLKRVYSFSLQGLTPDVDGLPDASDTVGKSLLRELLPLFFPYEKVEGMALTGRGELWVGLDNDGGEVEPRLVNTGRL